MPVRSLPPTDDATRILLDGIVDYAGLFPPAGLSMAPAVRNYAHYRAGGAGWMLGRFVCPASALEQFSEAADPLLPRDAGAIPWRLTAVGSGDVAADLEAVAAFNERHRVCFDDRGALVDAYEAKATSVDAVHGLAAAVPASLQSYIELPLGAPAAELDAMIGAVASTGRRAKMRTGGVTPDAFPTGDAIVNFLMSCIAHGVVAKATAGLHHTLCGYYRLQYDDESPTSAMFGFLNVFLAAALLAQGGTRADALLLLAESDPKAFETNDLHLGWRGPDSMLVFDRGLLQRVRQSLLVSFGSCSFTEPVQESRALGLV
ncbi:MAG TPA: hypothetical protein VE869_05230 [Gemmatimonas sp.]|nr:hypothetical protein [Gemmatimonas sp.]